MFVCFYVYIIPACESEAVEDPIRRTNNLNERFKKIENRKERGIGNETNENRRKREMNENGSETKNARVMWEKVVTVVLAQATESRCVCLM